LIFNVYHQEQQSRTSLREDRSTIVGQAFRPS